MQLFHPEHLMTNDGAELYVHLFDMGMFGASLAGGYEQLQLQRFAFGFHMHCAISMVSNKSCQSQSFGFALNEKSEACALYLTVYSQNYSFFHGMRC